MKILITRGAFLNPFEMQNYYPLSKNHQVEAVSSFGPINSQVSLSLHRLPSFTDLPNFPYKYPVLNRLTKDAHYLFGLEKLVKGSDIVHVAETYYHYTLQAIKAKEKGLVKRVVSTVWEVIPFNNESLPGRRSIKENVRDRIDHFITHTDLAKKSLIKEGVSPKKITMIPLGVDLSRFKPKKKKRTSSQTILFIGRLEEEKGILKLMEAFSKIESKFPNLKLCLVGEGSLKSEIPSHPRIAVKTVLYENIHLEYQKADIFCLPSQVTPTWQEQYGMVLVEAMASGLPIITTKTGAIPEVCGDSAIYTKNSSVGLASNLEKLLKNPNQAQALGKKARQRAVSLYNHKRTAEKIEAVYKKVLK
jgi:alpha-maltose-1-phosphate synthase